MSYNMMIGYEIYDRFTMEHFTLRQRMTLTTKIYCSLPCGIFFKRDQDQELFNSKKPLRFWTQMPKSDFQMLCIFGCIYLFQFKIVRVV
jgi:hypothetical protein